RCPLSEGLLEDQKKIAKLGPAPISEEELVWFTHFAGFVPHDVDPRTLPQWPSWMEHRQSLRTQDTVYLHEDSIERVRNFDKPVLLCKGIGSWKFLHDIIDILGEEFPNDETHTLPCRHAP